MLGQETPEKIIDRRSPNPRAQKRKNTRAPQKTQALVVTFRKSKAERYAPISKNSLRKATGRATKDEYEQYWFQMIDEVKPHFGESVTAFRDTCAFRDTLINNAAFRL